MTEPQTPPTSISGVPVSATGDPMDLNGETWLTLASDVEGDNRLWEFSTTTGRLIRTL